MTPLRQRYRQDLQLRNYASKTQEVYEEGVSLFARHFGKSPELLGPEQIRTYQLYLAHEKQASWSRFNQTVCALRFLYRHTLHKDWIIQHIPFPRKESRLPQVLSLEEVSRVLEAIPQLKYRMRLTTIYATGLRASEALHLEVADIDSPRMSIRVRQGKGHKDRYALLSPKLLVLLREYWKAVRPTRWLFPSSAPDRPVSLDSLQEAVRRARRASGLVKRVTAHTLRHYVEFRTMLSTVAGTALISAVDGLGTRHSPEGSPSYRIGTAGVTADSTEFAQAETGRCGRPY